LPLFTILDLLIKREYYKIYLSMRSKNKKGLFLQLIFKKKDFNAK